MDGQITIEEWFEDLKKHALPVEIKGLADDPYCPKCGKWLDDFENPCSCCNTLLDWARWEQVNADFLGR